MGVTAFCPSYVSTGMFAGARGPLLTPVMTPEAAVARAWAGLLAGEAVVMAPRAVRVGAVMRAVLPAAAFDVVVSFDVRAFPPAPGGTSSTACSPPAGGCSWRSPS